MGFAIIKKDILSFNLLIMNYFSDLWVNTKPWY